MVYGGLLVSFVAVLHLRKRLAIVYSNRCVNLNLETLIVSSDDNDINHPISSTPKPTTPKENEQDVPKLVPAKAAQAPRNLFEATWLLGIDDMFLQFLFPSMRFFVWFAFFF